MKINISNLMIRTKHLEVREKESGCKDRDFKNQDMRPGVGVVENMTSGVDQNILK